MTRRYFGTDGIRGTGTFTFGGGTLKVGSDLTTSNAMTLTAGKTATVDTNGNICVYVYGRAHILIDVNGWFS